MISVGHKIKAQGMGVYVGRPSPLGNPFVIGKDGDREEVIAKYRVWLWHKVKAQDPVVCAELARLEAQCRENGGHLLLTCWCAPLPCHADVIKAALEWRMNLSPSR